MALALQRLPDGSRPPRIAAVSPIGGPASTLRRSTRPEPWQETTIKYDEEIGVAGFANAIVADTIARTDVVIEEYDPATDEWNETEQPDVRALWQLFRNEWENADEIRGAHAWCYQVPGEGYFVVEDDADGDAEWFVYQPFAVDVRNTFALVRDDPTDPGRRVDREFVTRFWLPSRRWRRAARSPMRQVLTDLRAYRSLVRYASTTAESRALLAGMQWFPSSMVKRKPSSRPDAPDLLDQFTDLAERGYRDDSPLSAVVPFAVHGPADDGPPKPVDIGRRLDPNIQSMKESLLKDSTRGMNLPQAMLEGGGTSQGNHWSAWLVREEFWASAMGPLADRMHHHDYTETFLRPLLRRRLGMAEERVAMFRVGYDKTPVVVREDRTSDALEALDRAVIGFSAAREHGNWSEDDKPTAEDLALLLAVKQADTAALPDQEGGADTVQPGPPPEPQRVAPTAAAVATDLEQSAVADLSRQLVRAHDRTSARLAGGITEAYRSAMARAVSKVELRAKRRGAEARAAAARFAAGERSPAILAQAGVEEQEILRERFSEQEAEDRRVLAAYLDARNAYTADTLGIDVNDPDAIDRADAAAAFLIAVAGALALQELRGDVRGADLLDVTGAVPPAYAADTLAIAEGRATARFGADLAALPELSWSGASALDGLFRGAGLVEVWTWTVGSPSNPFERHQALHGLESEDPVGRGLIGPNGDVQADQFTNATGFPAGGYYYPNDHKGCLCGWTIELALPEELARPGRTAPQVGRPAVEVSA